MTPRHRVSSSAIELIKRFEGLRRTSARVADGRWTIGYGHTRSAREGVTVTAEDAEALLLYDLRAVARAVDEWTYAPLTQNQFDALVAFAFNVGLPAFRGSNVLRRVNEGNLLQAASAFDTWRRAEFEGEAQVIDALIRRRAAEKALFLTPPGEQPPVPTPVLPPQMDYGVGVLEETPLDLVSPLEGDPSPVRADDRRATREESAATRAADAAVSRLRAALPDEPVPSPFPAADTAPSVSLPRSGEGQPAEGGQGGEPPSPTKAPQTQTASDGSPRSPTLAASPPVPPHKGEGDTSAERSVSDLAPTPEPAPEEPRIERWPYVLLFLGGAVLFVAGISATMRADGLSAFAVALTLAGIACIGVSVYFLLKRIDAED